MLKIKTKNSLLHLVNYYCPNDKPLSLNSIEVPDSNVLVVGDFNSHSQSWGYDHADSRGEEVEEWQDDNNLILINSPHDPPTFYSRGWKTTSTPDLAFSTEDLHRGILREVGDQLGGSDHKPIFITISSEVTAADDPKPRWNYKKANWTIFAHKTNELTKDIRVEGRDIKHVAKEWTDGILQSAKESIPRGGRKDYKPFWTDQLQMLEDSLNEARKDAEDNPSQESAISLQRAKAVPKSKA